MEVVEVVAWTLEVAVEVFQPYAEVVVLVAKLVVVHSYPLVVVEALKLLPVEEVEY